MKKVFIFSMAIVLISNFIYSQEDITAKKNIHAFNPPKMAVKVDAGEATFPDGSKVKFNSCDLSFDLPEIREHSLTEKVPIDYGEYLESWEWAVKDVLTLKPPVDTLLLGGLYNGVIPESVSVKSVDGSKTYKVNEDFKYNESWGRITAIKGRLGKKGKDMIKVTYKYITQRIDLIQVSKSGKVSVKKGTPAVVCPSLPEADSDCVALAGIYIYTANHPKEYIITDEDIYPINPAKPVMPINKEAIKNTLEKLKNKRTISIGFVGDSITLGAEAGKWWEDSSLTYRGRVIDGISKRFGVVVKEIEGYKGGIGTKEGADYLEKEVLPKKPDLIIIALGVNDASGSIGSTPRITPGAFKNNMLSMVKKAKEGGADVMLVTPFQPSPFLKNGVAKHIPKFCDKLKEIGKEENVAVADVYTELINLATHGIPPFSQLHNWTNHPGAFGMKVYSDVILRFFE